MPTLTRQRARDLVRHTAADLSNRVQQNAEPRGVAPCSGCGRQAAVVYACFLQWCETCWPIACVFATDTQAKDWPTRRAGQVRDYGWTV
jgi:hypothetical protein